jgi:hypothetical protein
MKLALVPTGVGAVLYLLPGLRPLLSPREGALAGLANLAGQMLFFYAAHGSSSGTPWQVGQKYSVRAPMVSLRTSALQTRQRFCLYT